MSAELPTLQAQPSPFRLRNSTATRLRISIAIRLTVSRASSMAIAENTVDRGNKEATPTALAADFTLDDKVRDLFLKSPMETLEDFRYYFAEEQEINSFVAAD